MYNKIQDLEIQILHLKHEREATNGIFELTYFDKLIREMQSDLDFLKRGLLI